MRHKRDQPADAAAVGAAVIWPYDVPDSGYHDTQRCHCDGHCRNCFADLAEIRALHARLIAEQSPAAPDRPLHPQARYCSEWCRGRAKRERALDRRLTAAPTR